MTKTTHAAVAPRLPARSVDFNALNDACKKGDDAAQAFAEGLRSTGKPKPARTAAKKRPARAARKVPANAPPAPAATPPSSDPVTQG